MAAALNRVAAVLRGVVDMLMRLTILLLLISSPALADGERFKYYPSPSSASDEVLRFLDSENGFFYTVSGPKDKLTVMIYDIRDGIAFIKPLHAVNISSQAEWNKLIYGAIAPKEDLDKMVRIIKEYQEPTTKKGG